MIRDLLDDLIVTCGYDQVLRILQEFLEKTKDVPLSYVKGLTVVHKDEIDGG